LFARRDPAGLAQKKREEQNKRNYSKDVISPIELG
jgi:hypothetical protein